ncbi:MAG TPA: hypothetical protein VJ936_04325 [Desulfobacteraceae bacterium]|nr:hypothetical protein [Desulfobacteraceae bacterium]
MKKVKLFIGLIILVFAGLIIYQNRDFFFVKQALSLSLGVKTWNWTAPAVENVYYWGGCLGIGLLITGYLGLVSKLKAKKTIKSLNKTIESHLEMISSLKRELEAFKSDPYHKAYPESDDQPEETLATSDLETQAGSAGESNSGESKTGEEDNLDQDGKTKSVS